MSDGDRQNLPTHRIEHGGETRYAYSQGAVFTVCDELVAKYGGGVPVITPVNGTAAAPITNENVPIPSTLRAEASPPPERIMSGGIDLLGKARSEAMKKAGEESGFSFRETVYARGMPVIALGEENAAKSRREHDAKPDIGPACEAFRQVIRDEKRHDETLSIENLRMDGAGRIVTAKGTFALTEEAFAVLLKRMKIGGADYLSKCWPRLRAHNFNAWASKFDDDEVQAIARWEMLSMAERKAFGDRPVRDPIKLRLRNGLNGEIETYGVVTPAYTAFNVDKVAEAIQIAMPREAKGEISYDGHRTSVDILFHTDVPPKHFVAGEFFKAGIRVRASDSGDGSIIVSAIVWQNLCLNLIIIDEASKPLDRIRHIGNVRTLADRLRSALEAGKLSLAAFLGAWNYAVEERLTADTLDAPKGVEVPIKFEDALPGIYNGLYERELLPIKKPKEAIPLLMKMWGEDKSAAKGNTRAAIVNSITRYAHSAPMDAWEEDKLERAAGALLTRKAPRSNQLAALPYVPIG
jgi:hypothetical protein